MLIIWTGGWCFWNRYFCWNLKPHKVHENCGLYSAYYQTQLIRMSCSSSRQAITFGSYKNYHSIYQPCHQTSILSYSYIIHVRISYYYYILLVSCVMSTTASSDIHHPAPCKLQQAARKGENNPLSFYFWHPCLWPKVHQFICAALHSGPKEIQSH